MSRQRHATLACKLVFIIIFVLKFPPVFALLGPVHLFFLSNFPRLYVYFLLYVY